MAFTNNGLTDSGSGKGVTTHYKFKYDDALDSTAHPGQPEPARTNELIAECEADYNLMSQWFGGISLPYPTPIEVNVENAGGGAHWGPPIGLDPGGGDANLMRYLMVSEVTEMFMLSQHKGWFAPDGSNEQSSGEGLSHFLATQFLLNKGLTPFNDISNLWLNSPREDFVNHIDEYDHSSGPKSACALLFLYYLNVQLGFSIEEIVAAAGPQLTDVYRHLTGDAGDPFPFFKHMLDVAYPGTSTISGIANLDNPYPLGLLSFWVDKSSFGRDEVQDAINASGGTFPDAFWLVLEGFSINSFNSLAVDIPAPTGSFAQIPGISLTRSATPVDFENPTHPGAPQRIRIAYDVTFTSQSLAAFPAPGAGPDTKELDAHLTAGGQTLPASNAATLFELVGGADPYFTNIDPAQENVFYLSQDLRVFTATPGKDQFPVAGGPRFAGDSVAGAFQYVQDLLAHLNSNFHDPAGPDPFSSVLPAQGGAYTGDSSVTPLTVSISGLPPQVRISANYNFAIARVRLRGSARSAGAAHDAKVFFRLWSTETADTDYQTGSTYPSTNGPTGLPASPQVGVDHHTLPFFATGNLADQADYGAGGVNNRTIEILSGDAVWAYYGCFLNLYDSGNQIDGQAVQHWLVGTHHCIVAQIAYDDAPIVNANGITMTPENSDKLAQRNLQVTHSDNPGPPSAHRIPQTFDVRPSPQLDPRPEGMLDYPDELMIDWGQVPVGSVASIYWPQVHVGEVLSLADRLYGSHLLNAADAHTIECEVTEGVAYVPIPPGEGENLAGLLTIDLPQSVRKGQEFEVLVRRVATRRPGGREQPPVRRERPALLEDVGRSSRIAEKATPDEGSAIELNEDVEKVEPLPQGEEEARFEAMASRKRRAANWRYVVGTFGIKIPVADAETMLFREENTLAIMRWRLETLGKSRWYPVLERYLSYLSDRVKALGGDPAEIEGSPEGVLPPGARGKGYWEASPGEAERDRERDGERVGCTGKVSKLVYDRFGDFEGFVLDAEEGELFFIAREAELEEVVRRAWAERVLTTVYSDGGDRRRPQAIVLNAPPPPFHRPA